MAQHSRLTGINIHVAHAFEYANASARTGASGLTAYDVGKLARQLDDNSFWVLTDDSPVTWVAMGSSGGGGSALTIAEIDGSPSGTPTTLQFPNNTVTDQGGGVYRYTPAAVSAALARLAQTVVGSGGAASVTLSSISGSYEDLVLEIMGRGDASGAASVSLRLTINGDTDSNYDRQRFVSYGGGNAIHDQQLAAAYINIGDIPAATAPTSTAGQIGAVLPSYARTTFHKTIRTVGGSRYDSSGATQLIEVMGNWRSTAAITSLTLTPASGNFNQYTTITLYGRN